MSQTMATWSTILDWLAHELRSPAAVIGGYARLLAAGHVAEDDRHRILSRITEAAGDIGALSEQTAALAQQLESSGGSPASVVSFDALVDRAIERSTAARARRDEAHASGALVSCADPEALVAAMAAVIDAVAGETRESPLVVSVHADRVVWFVVGPESMAARLRDVRPEHDPDLLRARRQVAMPFVVATAVVAAHHGAMWRADGRPDAIGVSLPIGS